MKKARLMQQEKGKKFLTGLRIMDGNAIEMSSSIIAPEHLGVGSIGVKIEATKADRPYLEERKVQGLQCLEILLKA